MLKSDCVVVPSLSQYLLFCLCFSSPIACFHPFYLELTCLSMLISKSLNVRSFYKGRYTRHS